MVLLQEEDETTKTRLAEEGETKKEGREKTIVATARERLYVSLVAFYQVHYFADPLDFYHHRTLKHASLRQTRVSQAVRYNFWIL